jgi:hypothetical protein
MVVRRPARGKTKRRTEESGKSVVVLIAGAVKVVAVLRSDAGRSGRRA